MIEVSVAGRSGDRLEFLSRRTDEGYAEWRLETLSMTTPRKRASSSGNTRSRSTASAIRKISRRRRSLSAPRSPSVFR
jgi:hypothetical protein